MSPFYEKNFCPEGKRINTAIKFLETKDQKRKSSSPMKNNALNLKDMYILQEENKLDEPLSQASMSTLNTH